MKPRHLEVETHRARAVHTQGSIAQARFKYGLDLCVTVAARFSSPDNVPDRIVKVAFIHLERSRHIHGKTFDPHILWHGDAEQGVIRHR